MNKKSFLTGSVVGILITVLAAFIAYKSLLTQPDISLNS